MASVSEELERLFTLFERGAITREEFDEQKAGLLAQVRGDSQPSISGSLPGVPNQVGAYRILGHIGDGGMGTVYRGQHRSPEMSARQGGEVAIKVMHPHIARNQDFAERFEREAGLGMKLDHPGICKVHDLVMDGGVLALVMELVEGEPLSETIGGRIGPIPWQRAWPIFEQLLDSVVYMHGQEVLHRDIKPENVLLTGDGRLKLLDLGIAKHTGSGKTKAGVGMGTVDYMAPEQHTDASKVDERADVYGLGMTLYEMLAGRLPWVGEVDPVLVLQHKLKGELPPPTDFYPDIPALVVAAVMASLGRTPADRTASAEAMRVVLRGAADLGEVRPRGATNEASKNAEPSQPGPEQPVVRVDTGAGAALLARHGLSSQSAVLIGLALLFGVVATFLWMRTGDEASSTSLPGQNVSAGPMSTPGMTQYALKGDVNNEYAKTDKGEWLTRRAGTGTPWSSAASLTLAGNTLATGRLDDAVRGGYATPVALSDEPSPRVASTAAPRSAREERLLQTGKQAIVNKESTKAISVLRECTEVNDRSSPCWWELGWAYWLREDWNNVVQCWERVAKLDPNRDGLKKWLSEARKKRSGRGS